MQFSNLINYGLRMVVYLAMMGGVCSSHELAKAVDVPRDYLVQIAQLLRKGGIIVAYPGKKGGYELARDSSDISVNEVIKVLESNKESAQDFEGRAMKDGQPAEMRNVLDALQLMSENHDTYLDSITLETILEDASAI